MTLSFFKRRSVLIVLLILLIAVAFMATRNRAPAPAIVAKPAQVLEFLPSDVVVVGVEPLRQVLPLSGALRALNQVSVKAKVAGEVKEVLVRAGEAVSAGQVLIRIDTSEYQAKVDTARGALDVAQKALTDTVIKAPISGMISSRTIEPGEKVSIDNKLLDVVDLRQMELEAPVPTADILKVQLGQEVLVTVEGLPQAVTGKVVRINPATQSGSRSIMVYVRIDNPQGLLRAGMFADASLTLDQRDAVMTIPQTAIQTEAGKTYVYAIEAGQLVRRDVVLGMRGVDSRGNAVEVSSGLQSGAQIVKANLGNLNSGTPVRFQAPGAAVPPAAPAATKAKE